MTARDKTTGREQSITVQGASILSEGEVNRMIQEAETFAAQDRERRERIEKRNSAKALTDQAQRRLKEVTLDFGSAFTVSYRRQVDALCSEILDSLEKDDERRLDRAQADLQDVLYELNREVRLQYDDKEEGFFEAIKKTFTGDFDDDDDYYNRRPAPRDDYRGGNDYGRYDDYNYNAPSRREAPMPRAGAGRGPSLSKDYRSTAYADWDQSRVTRQRPYQGESLGGTYDDRRSSPQDDYSRGDRQKDYDYRENAPSRSGRGGNGRYGERPAQPGRNAPLQNGWDDDDDDWF